MFDVLITQLNG